MSAACVLVLLLIGFAHHLGRDHYNVAASDNVTAGSAICELSSDEAACSNKGTFSVELCAGCIVVTLPALAQAGVPAPAVSEVGMPVLDLVPAPGPAAATPPPKRLT